MTILGTQIPGVLFAVFMLYVTFLHHKRKEFTSKESVFWFGTWLIFLGLVFSPTSLDYFIKQVLNFGRRLDFFIILGFMFLLFITFHTYTIVRRSQNKIEKVVRTIAIENEKR